MDNTDFEAVLGELRDLKVTCGLHTRQEKRLLWNLAGAVGPGVVVEIGSFEGYSTIILAKALSGNGHVYAIDPHTGVGEETDNEESACVGDTWPRFNENICRAGVSHVVTGLKMKSVDAVKDWGRTIDLLYIDGSHRYEDVKQDFFLWRQHLVPGGRVIFHDVGVSGVRKVIAEDVLPDRAFSELKLTPCCMFSATWKGETRRQYFQKANIKIAFWLRGAIGENKTLRRCLSHVLQRLG